MNKYNISSEAFARANNNTAVIASKAPGLAGRLSLALLLLLTTALSEPAHAQVRTWIPDEDPGPPFYARVERSSVHTEIVPHTNEWAAVVFYRSPSCVPTTFNLMDLFDVPRAFSCDLTIDGFEIWKNGPPPIDMAPMQARLDGLGAVPVWFVSWPELQAAVADDYLTIMELESLSSLRKGTATFFRETLHPTGGAQNPKLMINAHGILEDGQTFQLHHSGSNGGIQTEIAFR